MPAPKKLSLFALMMLFFSFPSISADTVYSTWNIEWLTSQPSEQFKTSKRSQKDFDALKRHFESINPDVLGFQEVNDIDALTRVVGTGYQVFFSQRSESSNRKHQFDDINQYTGFAVRKGIKVKNQADLLLDKNRNSKLRFATYIIIESGTSQPIHALSVHLKARCSGAYKNSRDCRTLKQQGQALNQWIKQRESHNQPYLLLGDFNHNLSYRGDWLWEEISQGSHAVLASKNSDALCKVKSRKNPQRTHQFRTLIDHVVTSHGLQVSTPKQNVFPVSEVLNYQLSDHCPLSVTVH